jgi:hypothetical protein
MRARRVVLALEEHQRRACARAVQIAERRSPRRGCARARWLEAKRWKTVCVKGPTATIRPPTSYTNALKKQQLAAWHYPDQNPSHHEEDHLISLELGGAPWSKKNLWPEPHSQSAKSHPRENAWHKLLCSGTLTVKQAQARELACKRAHE